MSGASLRDRVLSPTATEPSFTVSALSGGAPLRVLSLFAGIGGFDLGLERTGGFETVAFCEILPFCHGVLKRHWPGVAIYDDVRELSSAQLAADGIAVDCIVGGFPCQDISLAGEGAGLEGDRSGLWWEYHRLIGELDPAVVILENVAELLGRGFGDVLGSLAALGYDAWWDCIPAFAVGAEHERDRVWAVAAHDHQARLSRGLQARADSPDARDIAARIGLALASAPQVSREHGPLRPLMGGRSHGVPDRLDRIAALGNSVVPQIPELIGRAILAAIADRRDRAMAETWLPAPDYEGRYEVSNLGRIRSLPRVEIDRRGRRHPVKGRILSPAGSSDGYLHVSLRSGGKLRLVKLHRLVALAFHGDKWNPLHREVAHLDGDPTNARADNLKWVSKVENHSHKRAHGTHQAGEKHPSAKLTNAQALEASKMLKDGVRGTVIAQRFGVSPSAIYCINSGRNWGHVLQTMSGGADRQSPKEGSDV